VSSVAIHIVRHGDHLFAEIDGNKNEIFPESLREYFFNAFDAQITFVTDSKNRATELILHEGAPICTPIGSNNLLRGSAEHSLKIGRPAIQITPREADVARGSVRCPSHLACRTKAAFANMLCGHAWLEDLEHVQHHKIVTFSVHLELEELSRLFRGPPPFRAWRIAGIYEADVHARYMFQYQSRNISQHMRRTWQDPPSASCRRQLPPDPSTLSSNSETTLEPASFL
jgi:hypothetical protein